MSDTFRLVTLEASGRLRLGVNMNDSASIYRERGTFKISPGARRDSMSINDTRFDSEVAIRSLRGNATATVTLVVKDATSAKIAIERVEEFLSYANRLAANGALLIECKPDALLEPALLRIQGPATLTPLYDPTVFVGAQAMKVEASWPIAPLAEGQPMDLIEKWAPPADKPYGTVNDLSNPSFEKAVLPWTSANASSWVTAANSNARYGTNVGVLTLSNSSANITSEALLCTAGDVKTISFDIYTLLAGRSARIDFMLLRADATTTTVSSGALPLTSNNWTRVAFSTTIPSGGSPVVSYQARLYPYLTGGVAADIAYIDAAMTNTGTSSTYIDGDGPLGRWAAEPHNSKSIELSENQFAEYTFPTIPSSSAVVDIEGLHTVGGSVGQPAQQLVHTGRGYAWADGEVTSIARVDVVGSTEVHTYILSPGLGWQAGDKRFIWATISVSSLTIYYFNGVSNAVIASVTDAVNIVSPFVAGRTYSCVLRKTGDLLEAEFWVGQPVRGGTPNKALAVKLTSATLPTAADMGSDRKGYPLPRSWGAADVTQRGTIMEFRALPYSYSASRSPTMFNLRGVPGSAPARADIEINAGSNPTPFGVIGWRERLSHNRVWNGNFEADLDGWSTATQVNVTAGAVLARVATGGPKDSPYATITAPAAPTANTGGYFISYERAKNGRRHTVEFWANEISGSWDVFVTGDNLAADSTVTAINTVGGTWTKNVLTFTPTVERERFDVVFRQAAATASSVLRIAGVRLYEGDPIDAPTSLEQTNGSGARPPFGLIHAEGDDISARVGFAGAVQAGSLTGRRMAVDSATAIASAARVEYLIDPMLISSPDVGGSPDVDFEIYAVYTLASTAVLPKLIASISAHDLTSNRQYTRENGASGKKLTIPSAGTVRRTARIGTLTVDRRGTGRQKLRIEALFGAGSTGTFSLECFVLAPAEARAASPSGLVYDTTYPIFVPANLFLPGVPLTRKRFRSDLSGQVTNGIASSRDTALSGEPIELKPGDNEMFVFAQEGGVADDPTIGAVAAVDSTALGVHVAITPRYYLFRPA